MKRILLGFAFVLSASLVFAIEPDAYKFVQMNSTTTVNVGAAKLHSIVICSSQTATAFTVYDSTHVAGTSVVIASFTAPSMGGTYLFDAQTQDGIQVNCPANGPNITVIYR